MDRGYETLSVEDKGVGLVLLTLNRPQVANAMNTQMGRDLLDFFDAVNGDPTRRYRCIVMTGAGDKAFCAGGDLEGTARHDRRDVAGAAPAVRAGDPRLYQLPGAGHRRDQRRRLCRRLRDWRCAAISLRRRDARFALTEVTLGIMPGPAARRTCRARSASGAPRRSS